MPHRFLLNRLSITLLAVFFLAPLSGRSEPAPDLEVWTWNIRYGSANDGPDHWNERRESVLNLLRESDAQLILLQEAEAFQVDQVNRALPGHAVVSRGRTDGRLAGEHVPILFCSERFSLVAAGTFWHSDTPDQPGSRSWGNEIPRICTWVRLQSNDGAPPLAVFNLHLDHRSQESRMESIKQVLTLAEKEVAAGHRVIIGGDLNAADSNPLHRELEDHAVPWTNAHRSLNPDDATGTFNGFNPERVDGQPIDFIYIGPGLKALESEILLDRTPSGRWPSDHFPVRAKIKID